MSNFFNGKTSTGRSTGDYDFLEGVFEWVFYNLPPRADNSYMRTLYNFYKTNGGLSKKQLESLLKTINGIPVAPPFNPATLEAIMRKKQTRRKQTLPVSTPLYADDTDSRTKLETILKFLPAHKAAIVYLQKLQLHQPLAVADKDNINKIFQAVQKRFPQ